MPAESTSQTSINLGDQDNSHFRVQLWTSGGHLKWELDIRNGNRHLPCSFSNPASRRDLLTCDDASCLTRCHRAFVSNSCHFFRTPLSIPWRHTQSLRHADQPVRKLPSRDGYPRRSSHIVQRRVLRQNSCRTAPPSSCDATNELTDFSRFQSTFLSQIGQSRVGALRGAGPLAGRAFARNRAGVVAVARRNARPKADSER